MHTFHNVNFAILIVRHCCKAQAQTLVVCGPAMTVGSTSVKCVYLYSLRGTLFYGSWPRDSPIVPDLFQFKYIRLREYMRVRDFIGCVFVQSRFAGTAYSKEPFIYWFFRVACFLQSILCQFTNEIGNDCYVWGFMVAWSLSMISIYSFQVRICFLFDKYATICVQGSDVSCTAIKVIFFWKIHYLCAICCALYIVSIWNPITFNRN